MRWRCGWFRSCRCWSKPTTQSVPWSSLTTQRSFTNFTRALSPTRRSSCCTSTLSRRSHTSAKTQTYPEPTGPVCACRASSLEVPCTSSGTSSSSWYNVVFRHVKENLTSQTDRPTVNKRFSNTLHWITCCTKDVLLNIQFSQGGAATNLRWGGRFFKLFYSSSTNAAVKELLKLVHIYQSYFKNKSSTFLLQTTAAGT